MAVNSYIQEAGIERFASYQPGGFHPVHLGDKFKHGRYTVLNKLGYGSYSTVWLVRDEVKSSYASLKILSAAASESSSGTELEVLRHSASGSGAGKRYVLQYLDDFTHRGPNGTHLCVVTEVSGPSLSSCLEGIFPFGELPSKFSRTFIPQIAQGVEYLHSCDIVHGDLHMGNILYHSSVVNLHSQRDVERYFGQPETTTLRVIEGTTPPYDPPNVPRYVVYSPDSSLFLEPFFQDSSAAQIKICDFSEASLHDPAHPAGTKRTLNCPNVHAAPEVIFDDLASPASDIWAMGNTMHQILTGGGTEGVTFIPGAERCSKDDVVSEMVRLLGKLPERWWSSWEARSEYYDEEVRPVDGRRTSKVSEPLGSRISTFYLPGEQKTLFEKVLKGIFCYEPRDRLCASEVVTALLLLEGSQDTTSPAPAPAA